MPNSGFYQNGEIIICRNRAQTKEEIETEIGHQLIIAYDVCPAQTVGFVSSNNHCFEESRAEDQYRRVLFHAGMF